MSHCQNLADTLRAVRRWGLPLARLASLSLILGIFLIASIFLVARGVTIPLGTIWGRRNL